jgi:hypothetical protein
MAIIINGQGRVGVRVAAPSGGGGGGTSYLLDTYGGAAAAYSLRKLSSTYSGNAIRVRRSSDNTEQNIGFDGSGNLDTSALTTFVGAGNGFVVTIFDQSGNGINMTSSFANRQAKIVSSGVVELLGTKPCLNTTSINTLYRPTGGSTFIDYKTLFTAGQVNSTTYSPLMSYQGGYEVLGVNDPWGTAEGIGKFYYHKHDYGTNYPGSPIIGGRYVYGNSAVFGPSTNPFVWYINMRNTYLYASYNGNSETQLASWGSAMRSDYFLSGNDVGFKGKLTEIIFYNSDKSANKSAIESNINTYYSIY